MESKKRKNFSLAFKQHILLILVVIIVAAVLVTISYRAYKKTTFEQIYADLDRIDQREANNQEYIAYDCTMILDIIASDGYQKARSEAEAGKDSNILRSWLQNHMIEEESHVLFTKQEFDKIQDQWIKEAVLDGVDTQDNEAWIDWLLQVHPEYTSYIYIDLLFSETYNLVREQASMTGVSDLTIYAEAPDQIVLLITASSVSEEDTTDEEILCFGERFDHVEAIDAFKDPKQSDGKGHIFLDSDDDPKVVRIIPAQKDGIQLYFVYGISAMYAIEGQRNFMLECIILVAVMVVIIIVISLLIQRRMVTKPLGLLVKAVDSFRLSDEDTEQTEVIDLPIRKQDEIGVLYQNIRDMETRIIEDTRNITRMTADREKIRTELNLAREIQASVLPGNFPAFPERSEFDLYALMDPAKEVGGDFYDFFLIDEDHLCMVIADVSDKGIPAALFMMSAKNLINFCAGKGGKPSEILQEVNLQLCKNNASKMFVTVWLGILEISTGKLLSANAGHECPFHRGKDGVFRLVNDPHGLMAGAVKKAKYKDYEIVLSPGDIIFVYTDGVPEASNNDREFYGMERLMSALNKEPDLAPQDMIERVKEEVNRFVNDAKQFDDLTMLCMAYYSEGAKK